MSSPARIDQFWPMMTVFAVLACQWNLGLSASVQALPSASRWVWPFGSNVGRPNNRIHQPKSHEKTPPKRGLREEIVLLSADDFLTAVNKNWTLRA